MSLVTKNFTYNNTGVSNVLKNFASMIANLEDKPSNGVYDSISVQFKYIKNNMSYMTPLTQEEKIEYASIKLADYTVALYSGVDAETRRRYLEFNATLLSRHHILGRLRYLMGIAAYDHVNMKYNDLKSDIEWFYNHFIKTVTQPSAPSQVPVRTPTHVPVQAPRRSDRSYRNNQYIRPRPASGAPRAPEQVTLSDRVRTALENPPPPANATNYVPNANTLLTSLSPFGYCHVVNKSDLELRHALTHAVSYYGYSAVYNKLCSLSRIDRERGHIHGDYARWMESHLELVNPDEISIDDFNPRDIRLTPFGYTRLEEKNADQIHGALIQAIATHGVTNVYKKVKFLSNVELSQARQQIYANNLEWITTSFTA